MTAPENEKLLKKDKKNDKRRNNLKDTLQNMNNYDNNENILKDILEWLRQAAAAWPFGRYYRRYPALPGTERNWTHWQRSWRVRARGGT